jgi:membrane peptidoglycan carboxypeptidase
MLTSEVIQIKHQQGLDARATMDQRMQRGCHSFMVKNAEVYKQTTKYNQYACVTKNRLVFEQTNKETIEALT